VPEKVSITAERAGNGLRLTIAGGLTVENAGAIKKALLEALEDEAEVHLELGEATSVDLSFMQILFAARAKAEAEGKVLTASSPRALALAAEEAGFPRLLE
jgi:anti-anti-sigma regulatory factor